MSVLMDEYKIRLKQLNKGSKELYIGEKANIISILSMYNRLG